MPHIISITTKDPMWGESATRLAEALILELLETEGVEWSWSDLRNLADKPSDEVFEIAKHHDPVFVTMTEFGKKWQSILIALQSHLSDPEIISTIQKRELRERLGISGDRPRLRSPQAAL
jgi:hypothetical protein